MGGEREREIDREKKSERIWVCVNIGEVVDMRCL